MKQDLDGSFECGREVGERYRVGRDAREMVEIREKMTASVVVVILLC